MNVTDTLECFSDDTTKVGKYEAGISAFNQVYDTSKANQEKAQTMQILELKCRKVHGQINKWNLVMIISTAIQNVPAKVWTDYFVAVNLHFHHCLSFFGWIKKIVPAVKTVYT